MARARLRRRYVGIGVFVCLLVLLVATGGRHEDLGAQGPDPCTTVPVNPIACENSRPGNPASEWDISGAGSSAIQGFATEFSVNRGQTVGFKVSTAALNYRIDIYRLGYYGGLGARRVAQISVPAPIAQPACTVEAATGLIDCGVWAQSASWAVPADATSGIYVAKLVRTDGTAGSSHIVFVVRNDTSSSDILFQTSDTTWQAYNSYGGNSLYTGSPAGRAYKVSYNRPFNTRGVAPEDWLFNAEYPMLRWLEANGYNVSYFSGIDSDRRPAEILEHRMFMSVGHDEYWSGGQRANVEAARDAGVHLAFFSGNEVFWKTRWENSIDGSSTPYRTLVSYKDTHANAKIDPVPGMWTGTWRDPRFSPPNDGGRPENALTGQLFTVNCCTYAISVPEALGKMRLWRNTSVATLAPGTSTTLADGTLGYEWDEDIDNGFRPAGLFRMSSTTISVPQRILDHGSTYGAGSATHSLTMYRASSGALVFGAGTVQWSWGLDAMHDRTASTPDTRMRQATVNLFADMGVQPSTLQAGLTAAVASTDTTAPSTAITAPAGGESITGGTGVTISGTASDVGGAVAAVEVSVDGGVTWRAATGRASWTFAWTAGPTGPVTLRSRAIDDSGNVQSPGTSISVTVTAPTGLPGPVAAYSFDEGTGTAVNDVSGRGNHGTLTNATWTTSGRNGNALSFNGTNAWVTIADSASLDLTTGMTIEAWVRPVLVTGWRTVVLKETAGGLAYSLYSTDDNSRPSPYIRVGGQDRWVTGPTALVANTWTHLATTYDGATLRLFVNGAQVATSSSTGAMNVSTSPLRIGGNAVWGEYFSGLIDDVRVYSRALSASEVMNDMNTPVVPPDAVPPTVVSVVPAAGAINVAAGASVSAVFNEPMTVSTIGTTTFQLTDTLGAVIPATVTYDAATRTATLVPTAPLVQGAVYNATVRGGGTDPRVKDVSGNALAASHTWSFMTAPPPPPPGGTCPCTIFAPTSIPAEPEFPDPQSIEIGVKFQSDRAGFITAIRFYKGVTNTGTHTGNLWSATGQLLAQAAFVNETASGWQQAMFAPAVQIAANTTYVASYHAPNGRYAADAGFFTNGVTNGPLRALADVASGGNGVYAYGTLISFPNQSFGAANYWVDVVVEDTLSADTTPPVSTTRSPGVNATSVPTSPGEVTVGFNEPLDGTTVSGATFELRAGTTLVPATVTYNSTTRTASLLPLNALLPSTVYTATVRGGVTDPRVKDVAGNALAANLTWSFTTAAAPPPPPDEGPGGPILIVASSASPITRYLGEILRTEGLNLFRITDISFVTTTTLNAYDVVLLGDMPLTAAQVTMFTNWVTAGGNLIAMRPDKQLAGLMGLTDAAATLSNQYLQIGAAGPGAGLVSETIQFHGTADRYTLNGATAVATLYSNATTATVNPAVSLRAVGAAGGQAAAFTFDLARSIALTRQGNPAWAGQERDGTAPLRSSDLFFGAAAGDTQPDWIDLNKVAIPQADEQQRLLANLILQMNTDRKPVPRIWYLPRGLKAAVVMTGDDHARGGTAGRFDAYKASSPVGCSVADWQCIRSTSYIYPATPLTNEQAASYTADGFEVGLHITTDCSNFTASSLNSVFTSQFGSFTSKYTSVPRPSTNRTHCIAWSGWATQALVSLANGVRFDTNYYYWPGAWIQNRPGMFTGSGMPMRFTDSDGSIIDVYQATTQLTDESNQTFPFNIDALLDRAIGPEGYYGVFTANMHTDNVPHTGSDAIIASAIARNVPVVSAKQMLTWLDGRNGSSFGNVTFANSLLSFTMNLAGGSNGLQVLLPRQASTGTLAWLRLNGLDVPFTIQTIKGIEYVTFAAAAGPYQAAYGVLPNTTLTSTPASSSTNTSASFSFTSTPDGATFQCSLDGAAYTACTSPAAYSGLAVGSHTFGVRAVNGVGPDATPATFAWTITSTPSPTGIVAAFGFEEGTGTATVDSSGSGNNGTLSNATWSTAGRFGNALSFNGTNAMVNVADSSSLDLTTAMTVEAWVRPAALAGWQTVVLKEVAGGLIYSLYSNSDASRPSTWIRHGGSERGLNGTAALAVDTWTHLAVTYDGANVRLYVNGTQVASRAQTGAINTSTGALRIGGNVIWGEYFSGLIDEVRIYSRALTAAQIQADMTTPVRP